MKLQRHRFRIIVLVSLALLCALGVFWVLRSFRPSASLATVSNDRLNVLKSEVIPGQITDRAGSVLAATQDGQRIYPDPAERRASLVHLLGESSGLIPGGVETLHAADLYGARPNLAEAIGRLIRKEQRHGYDLRLTVSADLCEMILRSAASHPETANRALCAVVMNYSTGEILAMSSLPTFDPSGITPEKAESLRAAADQPLLNRVTEGAYPLGTLEKVFPVPVVAPGRSLSVFRDLVTSETEASQVTPLRLCLMTCAVAADGEMPEPRLIENVKTAAGAVVVPWSKASLGRCYTSEQAAAVRETMKAAVNEGSAAALYDPVLDLHALTGSSGREEEDGTVSDFSWCTGFNGQNDFPCAVCVLVEEKQDGGNEKNPAALIAKDLFNWMKAHPQLIGGKE